MTSPTHHQGNSAEIPARLFRAAILFGICFMVIRTVLVEPFGVPTGSMAPTLLGNHRECPCPRCGYPVVVGELPNFRGRDPYANAICDNCGKIGISLSQSVDLPGDRLIVDKNVFSVRSPRRWEQAVFRCPVDPSPYVKRIVGLPGEQIQILGGDIFINGEICRKSFAQLNQMSVPVCDSTYEPEKGWSARWFLEGENSQREDSKDFLKDGFLSLASPDGKKKNLVYHQMNLDFLREEVIRDLTAYNAGTGVGKPEPIHDFLVSFDLKIIDSRGRFSCQVTDGFSKAAIDLQMGSGSGLSIITDRVKSLSHEGQYENQSVHHFELAFFDRRVVVHENGKELFEPYDLPADPTIHGRRPSVTSPFRFELTGGHVEISNVRLFRDVHYRSVGENAVAAPYQLGPDEYFALGDNSVNSRDSRVWSKPGVPTENFLGKPFLIHQPMHLGHVSLNGQERTFPTLDWNRLKWVR